MPSTLETNSALSQSKGWLPESPAPLPHEGCSVRPRKLHLGCAAILTSANQMCQPCRHTIANRMLHELDACTCEDIVVLFKSCFFGTILALTLTSFSLNATPILTLRDPYAPTVGTSLCTSKALRPSMSEPRPIVNCFVPRYYMPPLGPFPCSMKVRRTQGRRLCHTISSSHDTMALAHSCSSDCHVFSSWNTTSRCGSSPGSSS